MFSKLEGTFLFVTTQKEKYQEKVGERKMGFRCRTRLWLDKLGKMKRTDSAKVFFYFLNSNYQPLSEIEPWDNE